MFLILLTMVHEITRPSGPPFTLNLAIDRLLKEEFDQYRVVGKPHPVMEQYEIDALPLQHEQLDTWRNSRKGVQVEYEPSGFLVYGAVDDLWVSPKCQLDATFRN
ncbi:MAG: hypothetical protein HY391_02570 [Deltaproteobacteria bacterium]|nr:hypothetical protein [Deltaproteobacteria bacterium]